MCMGHQHTGIDSTHPQGAEEVCIQLVLHEALLFHWHFFSQLIQTHRRKQLTVIIVIYMVGNMNIQEEFLRKN